MKKMPRFIGVVVGLVVAVAAGAFLAGKILPTAAPLRTGSTPVHDDAIALTAVGDSLTHGVGDTTNQGGYVPLIAQDIKVETGCNVTTSNYGVTGDTSLQIDKRVRKNAALAKKLRTADIITVTVGGNDLMHILQAHFLDIKTKDVTVGINKFQTHLKRLIADIRLENDHAPIYVFGIYNPFYVYFKNVKNMQKSVERWNAKTQRTLGKLDKTYYVDIDSVLTKGNGSKKLTKAEASSAANNLIYGKDHFHPNNAGYVQMTSQLWTVMQQTKNDWGDSNAK